MRSIQEPSATRDNIIATGQRMMANKGFTAVGLNEILKSSGVPKGSFYHYFDSKDGFGQALLKKYFEDYVADMDRTFSRPGFTMAERLMMYVAAWQETQSFSDCQGKCLAVKLGAEVADLSEPMRRAMMEGTAAIVVRLTKALEIGAGEGSLKLHGDAALTAQSLYQLWLGASVMVKVVRDRQPFDAAMATTRQLLGLSPA